MYENSDDLDAISRRQLEEDVSAYRYDIDFTRAMLANPDITPSEIRSLHVRILDSSHHLRHCRHRLEVIEAQSRLGVNGVGRRAKAVTYRPQNLPPRTGSATPAPNGAGGKRKRAKTEGEEDETTTHEIRSKVYKMVKDDEGQSRWAEQGVGECGEFVGRDVD